MYTNIRPFQGVKDVQVSSSLVREPPAREFEVFLRSRRASYRVLVQDLLKHHINMNERPVIVVYVDRDEYAV